MKHILRTKKSGFNHFLEPKFTEIILNSRDRKLRWLILGFTASFSFFISVSKSKFGHRIWPCPFFYCTGIPCPGCGITRSFIALVQGDFNASFQYHAFGIIFMAIAVITVFQIIRELLLNKKLSNQLIRGIIHPSNQLILGIIFLSYYFLRLSIGYPAIFYETFS